MAGCRVYLFTYKRNGLLPRAVSSLINQTYSNWICEVHNDDPSDSFPSEYVLSLNDPRFIIKDHAQNLGGVASFNLAFNGCAEEYASILEDDNWWEPIFLKEMADALNNHPMVNVAWSNMRLWQELPNNKWIDTGKTTWPIDNLTLFNWPDKIQPLAALHSIGAMMYRTKSAQNYIVPGQTLLNAVELIRERSFEHPLYLNTNPLANFAITLNTNRSSDPFAWIASQTMMLASFVVTSNDKHPAFNDTLKYYRTRKPNPVAVLFLANFLLIKDAALYKYFKPADWLTIGKWLLKNGLRLGYMRQILSAQKETYKFLLKNTKLRHQESSHNI
jgi:glycosyltransferase involved in cell wall biosynthesis